MAAVVASIALAIGTLFAQQIGNPITPPPVINNVTNVFPSPDPALVVETQRQAAPVVLQSGLQAMNTDAGRSIGEMFNLGLSLGRIRSDMILLPVVHDLNSGMNRIVLVTLALVLAALASWGIIGQYFGSDGHEAFETIGRAPLWCVLALTSMGWYALGLNFFAALGGMIATAANGAFGPTMRPDFWSNVGLGIFAHFVGLLMLLNLLLFALQLFSNTAFLAFCAIVAPVFVFLKTTPWTSHWGSNWFRMVPGTAGDMLAMLALLAVGAAGLEHVQGETAFGTIGMQLGLLLCLPLVRRLFGLEGNSVGSALISAALIARVMRGMRHSAPAAASGPAMASASAGGGGYASPTSPSKAPRWSGAATAKSASAPTPRWSAATSKGSSSTGRPRGPRGAAI